MLDPTVNNTNIFFIDSCKIIIIQMLRNFYFVLSLKNWVGSMVSQIKI